MTIYRLGPQAERVYQAVRGSITTGGYAPGDRLPSYEDLARQHDVAPMTVRHALSVLEDEGLVRRLRGKGTFVMEPAARREESTPNVERSLSLLLDHAPVLYCTIDPEGTIIGCAGGALATIDRTEEWYVGRSVFRRYADVPGYHEALRRALEGQQGHVIVQLDPGIFDMWLHPAVDSDGTVTHVDVIAVLIGAGRVALPAGISHHLAALAQSVGVARDFPTIFRALLAFLQSTVPCSGLIASLYDPVRDERRCIYAWSDGEEEDAQALPPMPMNDAPHSRAVRTGQIVVTDDLQAEIGRGPVIHFGLNRDPRTAASSIAVPMMVGGRAIGGFEVQSVEPAAYSPEHVGAVHLAGNLAAIGVANVQLIQSLRIEVEERQQAEHALWSLNVELRNRVAEQKRLAAIVESSGDAIMSCSLDGLVTTWNPGAEALFGYTAEEMVNRPLDRLIPSQRLQETKEMWNRVASGETLRSVRTVRVRKDGTYCHVAVTLSPICDEDGRVVGMSKVARDVSREMGVEEAFRTLADHSPDVIARFDRMGRYLYANEAVEGVSGLLPEQVMGRTQRELGVPDDHLRMAELARAEVFSSGTERTLEYAYETPSGLCWYETRIAPEWNAKGEVESVLWVSRDITARKQVEQDLQRLALYDDLTGLANRTLFADRLNQALLGTRRDGAPLTVLLLDLDRFREVNDTLGHAAGDDLLRQAGARFRSLLRDTDTVARLGGDEFAVILPDTDRAGAEAATAKILASLAEPFLLLNATHLYLDVSIGIAAFTGKEHEGEVLLRHAEVAMYEAKRTASGYAVYTPEIDSYSTRRLSLTSGLREAIERGQLLLHFQPKIDLTTGKVTGVEALARWRHPDEGTIQPGEFIAIAERTGLIRPLTRWVLDAALAQVRRWRDTGLEIGVAVNLSTWNFQEPDLVESVAASLDQHGVPARVLTLEITESALMMEPTRALHTVSALQDLGVNVSIDDFGTGYSSLAYLEKLPVRELKIDRSFITALGPADDRAFMIVQSILQLGHNLGLRVVAEGMETPDQAALLARAGFDEAQGYLFSPPLDMESFERWLAARRTTQQQARPSA